LDEAELRSDFGVATNAFLSFTEGTEFDLVDNLAECCDAAELGIDCCVMVTNVCFSKRGNVSFSTRRVAERVSRGVPKSSWKMACFARKFSRIESASVATSSSW
jgi:hypothetical protein